MGRIVVDIEDSLDEKFRIKTIKKFGSKKGALQMAITEAIKLWLIYNEEKVESAEIPGLGKQ